jgi:hypothetical protein
MFFGAVLGIIAIVVAFVVNLWGMTDFVRQFMADWRHRRGR